MLIENGDGSYDSCSDSQATEYVREHARLLRASAAEDREGQLHNCGDSERCTFAGTCMWRRTTYSGYPMRWL